MIRGLGQAVAAAGGFEFTPVVERVKDEDSDDTPVITYFNATISEIMTQVMARRAGVVPAAAAGVGGPLLPVAPAPDVGWALAAAGDNPADEV
jgi:hypothetical protein